MAPATGKIRIVIVDDHEIVRQGLRAVLGAEADMRIVGEAGTGDEAVRVAREQKPDVMLLDVRLQETDGPSVCERVLAIAPRTAVVMLTSYRENSMIVRSLAAGAKGYVLKDIEMAELKSVVRSVVRGHSVLDPKIASGVISAALGTRGMNNGQNTSVMSTLSNIDVAILHQLAQGRTNKEIARAVHRSPHTVKDRLEKIGLILDAHSRTEIVAEALRAGLI
jgi:DNA-binding NarL/FixJ family response regulator